MKRIPLTQGKYALVDDEDFEWLNQFKWAAHKDRGIFYAVSRSSRKDGEQKTIRMHRLILGLLYKDGNISDHRNGNGIDNQRHNLRKCTVAQNAANKTKTGNNKYRGVSLHKRSGKWYASITVNGKRKHLGSFGKETDAAKAYNKASLKYHGEYGRPNAIHSTL